MTPSGIEPVTFQPVPLNQLRHHVRLEQKVEQVNCVPGIHLEQDENYENQCS